MHNYCELTNKCNNVNHSASVTCLIALVRGLASRMKRLRGMGALGCVSPAWFSVWKHEGIHPVS